MTVERATRNGRAWQRLAVCLVAVLAGVIFLGSVDLGALARPAAQKDKGKGKDKGKDKDKDKKDDKLKEVKKPRPKAFPVTTIKAHKDWINRLALSADGNLLATASRDGTIKIWEVKSGNNVQTLSSKADPKKGPALNLKAIAFSPDGTRVATNGGKFDKKKGEWLGEIKIWDIKSGKEVAVLKGHSEDIEAVAFSPDGQLLASASKDKTINVYNVKTSKLEETLKGHTGAVLCVAFDKEGKRLASGSAEVKEAKTLAGEIKIWDLADKKAVLTLKGSGRDVTSVAYSPDGKRLVAGTLDGAVLIFDASSGKELQTLKAEEGVWAVAISHDGKKLASVGWNETIKVWDLNSGKDIVTIYGHDRTVTGAVFLPPDNELLFTSGIDGTVQAWHTTPGKVMLKKEDKKEKETKEK